MRNRFKFLGAVAAGIAVAGTSLLAPATPSGAVTPSTVSGIAAAPTKATAAASIAWGACSSARLASLNAQCGLLPVPLDYANPAGAKIKLAVSRIRHTSPDAQYQGVMLTNPGGPGGSGLGLSVLGQFVPNGAGDYYDWIGFDPRGVGSSQPAVSCDPNFASFDRPNYIPIIQSDLNAWLAKAKAYTQACAAKNGPILNHLTTVDNAKDMESIRLALGVKQINYYGFSYGTYLGQVYSTLYPANMRRMVLDSNVDPTRIWYQANLDQDVAFNKNMKIWWAWLAKYDGVYHLGSSEATVESKFYQIQARLTFNPAGGKIGGDEWNDIFLSAGYYQQTWLDLAGLFADFAATGNATPVVSAYLDSSGLGDDNGFAIYAGTQCSDVQWPTDWNKWASDNWAVYAQAPYETWNNAWFNSPCLTWPAAAHTPVTVDGSKVAPALLIDETLDAATPYSGSLKVRSLFPKSSLIALPGGTSHANSLNGDACLDNQIAAYLAAGTLPKRVAGTGPDTTCAPLPLPSPLSAAAKTAVVGSSGSAATRSTGAAGTFAAGLSSVSTRAGIRSS